ncbi:FCD domain-containing protein [Gordonia jinghuaiqii]|uniref:GntR family transcriptional regulator n=1 Tax=Gordonia jinghuaiqii TaxID=2758710 RepID=A0A7D7LU06_9ACTN|nr:GntR family transcriptional regulator [Gordonia jinghuaiqii]MCR5977508.1 FCD domain-containing protein [Gordonia jinghuaiqii]QMT02197.1 GntR family transcriptional regulator [Gordonia jinghuaiqii]
MTGNTSRVRSVPRRESFDKQAAEWLRGAIIDGHYVPGQRLTEASLAQDAQVSRSTMRTALLHLAAEGLVVQEAYSGWKVTELTAVDAREVYTLRCALDGLAAQLAAQRMTPAGADYLRERLDTLLDAARERISTRQLAEADMAFHSCIVDLADNRRLRDHYNRVTGAVLLYVHATNVRASTETIVDEHTAIFEALRQGDPVAARRLAEDHVMAHGAALEAELAGSQHPH